MEKLLLMMSMSVSCLAQLFPLVLNRNPASFLPGGKGHRRPACRGQPAGKAWVVKMNTGSHLLLSRGGKGATHLFCQIQRAKK